jgi:hypothetical protein
MFDDLISWLQEEISAWTKEANNEKHSIKYRLLCQGRQQAYETCLDRVLIAKEDSQK